MTNEDFDEILTSLGTSKWNYIHFAASCLAGLMMPSVLLSGIYIAPKIDHTCNDGLHLTNQIIISDECHYLDGHNATRTCSSWEYESEYFPASMTEEFNLVCDRAYLRPTFQTSYMLGNFFGSPINGFIADRFGRRKLIIVGTIAFVSCGLVSSFLSNIFLIIALRFIMGLLHAPVRTTGYILALEISEQRHRTSVGVLICLPWAIGVVLYGIMGSFIQDWRWLQRISLLPGIISIIFLRYFSESPRWLIVSAKFDKALETLRYAAKMNGTTLPPEEEILHRMKRIQESALSETRKSESNKSMKDTIKNAISQITVLFSTSAIRKLTILMYMAFFTASFVYYSLTLNATNFGLDPYMYMIIGGIAEIPAHTLIIPIINKFGRVPPATISYLALGVIDIALAFTSSEPKWLILLLAISGKLFISTVFQLIYLVASEAYPTEVRMQGVGTCQLVSRIGGIIAPYITELVDASYQWVASLIFGVLCLVVGCLSIYIPETLNSHLPETVASLDLKKSENQQK